MPTTKQPPRCTTTGTANKTSCPQLNFIISRLRALCKFLAKCACGLLCVLILMAVDALAHGHWYALAVIAFATVAINTLLGLWFSPDSTNTNDKKEH